MLGILDFNKKKDKIYINKQGLLNGVRVVNGLDESLTKKIDPKEREFEKKKPRKVNPDQLEPIFQNTTRIKIKN